MSFGKNKEDAGLGLSAAIRPGAASGLDAMLGKGSKVIGTLTFSGVVELDCEIEGEVHAKDKLTIGESGQIKAKLHGADIIIRGNVVGDVIATRSISLKKPARLIGNISAPSLSIEEGVVFEGKCTMQQTQARPAEIKVAEKA